MPALSAWRANIKNHPSSFSIALPILLIGLLNLIWYMAYEYHNEGLNAYSDYLGASKKLILASILVFYLDRFKSYIDKTAFLKYFLYASGAGFVLATGYGLWQASQGMERVEMAINRPTVSAYVYSVLSLAFVYSLYLQKNRKLYVAAGLTILISYFVILLTATRRNGIIFAPGDCTHTLPLQKNPSEINADFLMYCGRYSGCELQAVNSA